MFGLRIGFLVWEIKTRTSALTWSEIRVSFCRGSNPGDAVSLISKAQREREKEERRESTEAKNQNYSNPKDFFEYNKVRTRETELLKTVPPTLNSFYKNKVSVYFYNFEEIR